MTNTNMTTKITEYMDLSRDGSDDTPFGVSWDAVENRLNRMFIEGLDAQDETDANINNDFKLYLDI